MTYTVLSAVYGDAKHQSIVAHTAEAGAVAFAESDRPDLWAQAQKVGVSAYVPPVVRAITPAEKLAAAGLTVADLRNLLGL